MSNENEVIKNLDTESEISQIPDPNNKLYSEQNRWGVEEYERETPPRHTAYVGEHESTMKMPRRIPSERNEAAVIQQSELSNEIYFEQSGYNEPPTYTMQCVEHNLS